MIDGLKKTILVFFLSGRLRQVLLYQQYTTYFQEKNKEIRDLKARMQTLFDEKEQIQTENQDLTKRKAKLELTIKDVQDELEGNAKAKVS